MKIDWMRPRIAKTNTAASGWREHLELGMGGLSKICERYQHSFVTSQGDVFKNQVGPFSEMCKNESNKND